MKLFYLILFSIGIYFLQFLILPFFNIYFNLFVPFALGFYLCRRKMSWIIVVSVIFDVFSGLPFPLMTISLLLTFGFLVVLYTRLSEESDMVRVLVVLPISLILYWLFVYLAGKGLSLFEEYFHFPFYLIFNLDLVYNILYAIGIGALFYFIFKRLSPKPLIYA